MTSVPVSNINWVKKRNPKKSVPVFPKWCVPAAYSLSVKPQKGCQPEHTLPLSVEVSKKYANTRKQEINRFLWDDDADRLTEKFISVVVSEFEKSGTLVEKYDVERCSADVSAEIRFGYSSNEIGFGWTNGVVRELIHDWQQRSP